MVDWMNPRRVVFPAGQAAARYLYVASITNNQLSSLDAIAAADTAFGNALSTVQAAYPAASIVLMHPHVQDAGYGLFTNLIQISGVSSDTADAIGNYFLSSINTQLTSIGNFGWSNAQVFQTTSSDSGGGDASGDGSIPPPPVTLPPAVPGGVTTTRHPSTSGGSAPPLLSGINGGSITDPSVPAAKTNYVAVAAALAAVAGAGYLLFRLMTKKPESSGHHGGGGRRPAVA